MLSITAMDSCFHHSTHGLITAACKLDLYFTKACKMVSACLVRMGCVPYPRGQPDRSAYCQHSIQVHACMHAGLRTGACMSHASL
mmetsp:Transcript_8359/g.17899  ORF Transcript_8359/g.17899 Transcript_8359/m.17899 type:complete len:85 (-) Transcript_8359:771-1025(-)